MTSTPSPPPLTQFLELKVAKLEQLLRLKDNRIHTLTARLQSSQLGGSGQ